MRPPPPISDSDRHVRPTPASRHFSPFDIYVVQVDGRAVVVVRGEIDPETAPRFSEGIDAAFAQAPRVAIDLSGVVFMDSAGIHAILRAFRRTGQNREAFAIRAPSNPVKRVLSITGLDEVLAIETEATSTLPATK
jgi:anti-anti-sigma factor